MEKTKITRRDLVDGRKDGKPFLARDPKNPNWISNGHWTVSLETHDPGKFLDDARVTRQAPVASAIAGWGERSVQYRITNILIKRYNDALLRVFKGPDGAWAVLPEHQRVLILGDALSVWAPAPVEGRLAVGAAGLEPGTGLCAAVMTIPKVAEEDIEEMGAFARAFQKGETR